MKVVVLGARGQLGRELERTCPREVEWIGLTSEDADITSREQLRTVLESHTPEVVVNCAAFVRTEACEEEPLKAFQVNAVGPYYLGQLCREKGWLLCHISTDFVFDGRKQAPYVETDPPSPPNTYGLSKYGGERFIESYGPKEHYILRTASLYGLYGARGKGGNFIYTILRKAREGKEPLKVVADIFMSPTSAWDVAKEIWRLLQHRPDYGIYHVVNDGVASWYDFAAEALKLAGIDVAIQPVSHREFPSKMKRALYTALRSERGIRLRPWQEALAQFIEEAKRTGRLP